MPFADMCDAHFIYYYRTFQMNSFLFVCFLTQGGRYSIMPNGDLHVHYIQIDDNDRLSSSSSSSSSTSLQSSSSFSSSTTTKTAMFRCQTKHLLTGEIKQSANYGRLIVTGICYIWLVFFNVDNFFLFEKKFRFSITNASKNYRYNRL